MKEIKITSIEIFVELINSIQSERQKGVLEIQEFRQEYYRGQSKDIESYKLLPSIARGITNIEDLKKLEAKYVDGFKNGIAEIGKQEVLRQGSDNFKYFNEWELIWQAQHYELPTRLLDWSIDPKIALYFSVFNSKHDEFDGQFWVMKIPMDFHDHEYEHLSFAPEDYLKSKLINPYFNDDNDFGYQVAELRRMRQNGKFFFQDFEKSLIPMEEQEELKQYLTKYIIPKESKSVFRDYLEKEKYTKKRLLPERDMKVKELINGLFK